ncbi:hypothetical protein ACMYZ5_10730 [Bacteroides sp. KG68]|uniref:hypothetical protein n=1 Tax=Bacteroides sp. KG69 TaxID=3397825 RepID=UPI003D988841
MQIADGAAETGSDGTSRLPQKGDCIIMPAGHPHAPQAAEGLEMLFSPKDRTLP